MAGKGESKIVAITPAMTPPATLLAINTPTPATEASMEDFCAAPGHDPHLENRLLENQLAERKIEVEELRDDLRLLRRGLSAKMKRLFEATGHKDLY